MSLDWKWVKFTHGKMIVFWMLFLACLCVISFHNMRIPKWRQPFYTQNNQNDKNTSEIHQPTLMTYVGHPHIFECNYLYVSYEHYPHYAKNLNHIASDGWWSWTNKIVNVGNWDSMAVSWFLHVGHSCPSLFLVQLDGIFISVTIFHCHFVKTFMQTLDESNFWHYLVIHKSCQKGVLPSMTIFTSTSI